MFEVLRQSRITVQENLYYQYEDQEPVRVGNAYAREVESAEQPWYRLQEASLDWSQLDFGWMNGHLGMVCIVNEGVGTLTLSLNPNGFGWIIYPGESFRGCPESSEIWVKASRLTTRFKTYGFPA